MSVAADTLCSCLVGASPHRPGTRLPATRWRSSPRRPGTGSPARSRRRRPPRSGAWTAVGSGQHALVVAPTGSGKTLAAFLWALDGLLSPRADEPAPQTRSSAAGSCTSPRSRRWPRTSSATCAPRWSGSGRRPPASGWRQPDVTVGVRTGDTPPNERRAFATRPPDILITTPESLYLVLTSAARAGLSRGADGDPRRDPRGRRDEAGRTPRGDPRTARRHARVAGAADRAVGHGPAGRRRRVTSSAGRAPRRTAGGRSSSCSPSRRSASRSTSSYRCRTCRTWQAHRCRREPAAPTTCHPSPRARSTSPARPRARPRGRRSGHTSRSASSTWSPGTARRSSSPTPAGVRSG